MNKRYSLDTNILIAFYNDSLYEEPLLELNQSSELWLSAVVLSEFLRGAHDDFSKAIFRDLLKLIRHRVFTPTQEQWIECAAIMEKLLKAKKRSKQNIFVLQNDILIALGTRDEKATLITRDQSDFNIIKAFIDLDIAFW